LGSSTKERPNSPWIPRPLAPQRRNAVARQKRGYLSEINRFYISYLRIASANISSVSSGHDNSHQEQKEIIMTRKIYETIAQYAVIALVGMVYVKCMLDFASVAV
jgi:superfamily I DNA and/or RNA helicase